MNIARKVFVALIAAAAFASGAASANPIPVANSYTLTPGTNFNFPVSAGYPFISNNLSGTQWFQLLVNPTYNVLTTFNLISTVPGGRIVSWNLYTDVNPSLGFVDPASPVAGGYTQDLPGNTFMFTALLTAGNQYALSLDPDTSLGPIAYADINVSNVPLPAAIWLFGSALFGFISLSNRRRKL